MGIQISKDVDVSVVHNKVQGVVQPQIKKNIKVDVHCGYSRLFYLRKPDLNDRACIAGNVKKSVCWAVSQCT